MNKRIFFIAIVLSTIIGSGYFYSTRNAHFKLFLQEIRLLPAPKIEKPENYNAVFVIFDPSGSGRSTYSVPRITVDFINNLIGSIAEKGKGDLWLTYISRNAYNNDVLHFEITKKIKPVKAPVRIVGERLGDFKRRLKEYKADSARRIAEIRQYKNTFNTRKRAFLRNCASMIKNAYLPKKPGQDYSDIIGSLNAGLRVFSTVPYDSTHFRAILLISDGVQDVPKGDPHKTLKQIPSDIRCVEVNHSGSGKDILAGRALEMSNLDQRVINEIVRSYNAKIQ